MNKNTAAQPEKTAVKGFIEGFLCNALNPKATLFFLSVFSQFLSSGTQTWVGWVYGLEIVIAVALWFTLLSCLITNDRFKRLYQRYSYWFDRILGAVLIFFAFKIFVSFFV
jgi:threonine/homoserine/homoserine lactone efflux protein